MEAHRFYHFTNPLAKISGLASIHWHGLLAFLLLSCIAVAQNPKQTGEDSWELKKEEEGVQVFIRNYKDTKLLEFKAISEVPAGLSTLISVIRDMEDANELFAASKEAKLVKKVNELEWLIWSYIDAPFPCDDRDMVVRMSLSQDKVSGIVTIDIVSDPEAIPEKKSMVRIPLVDGSITYIPLAKNQTRVIYQNVTDPGGLIPTWIINMGVIKAPFETLLNYRRLSEQEKHQDVQFDFIEE